jgi:hypothetical protein
MTTKKSVTLKRTVTIKAIVTEDFKKYLVFELQNAIKNLDQKMSLVDTQGKKLIETLKDKGAQDQINSINQQINLEKQQKDAAVTDLNKRIEDAKNLALNSEFIQGTVDGFVTVGEGDNLYQKLGALEIIIKDGIIQDIRGDSLPEKSQKK